MAQDKFLASGAHKYLEANTGRDVSGDDLSQPYLINLKPLFLDTIPFMVCVALTLASLALSSVCWYLTYDTEKEIRRIQALRRSKGKNENIVIDEDFEIDDTVRYRNAAR